MSILSSQINITKKLNLFTKITVKKTDWLATNAKIEDRIIGRTKMVQIWNTRNQSKNRVGNRSFHSKLPIIVFQINSLSLIESKEFRETSNRFLQLRTVHIIKSKYFTKFLKINTEQPCGENGCFNCVHSCKSRPI